MEYRDGKYKLIEFFMTAPGGRVVSLTPYCAVADIYESVLEPTAIAEFVISDKVGIFDRFNFLEQSIKIEFTTYEDNADASVKYEFFPVIVDPAEAPPDDKAVVYKLTCVSKEALKSTQIKNLSFSRQKIECERMIKTLLLSDEGLKTTKPIFLEKTIGLNGFNFTLANPFTAIDEIRLRAVSAEFQGSCFLFYENSKGYHFKSFEGLVKDGKTKIGDKYYVQSAATDVTIAGAKWRNILAFKNIQNGNQGVARRIGAGNNLVQLMDRVTGKLIQWKVDPRNLDFETLNPKSISATLTSLNEMGEDEGNIQIVMIDPKTENAERAEKKNHLPYYMAHFLTTISQITIYGDSTISVGDVIRCQLPEYDGLPRGEENPIREDSQMTSGNYIVTKCRHVLTFNEKAEYMQGLEIVKDGIAGLPIVHV
jgi:hypothetical protein